MKSRVLCTLSVISCALMFTRAALAQETIDDPVAKALLELSDEAREFNEHVVTLSSPFMEGRVPGSRGMEIAKEYTEFWLKKVGLIPGFNSKEGAQKSSWRQPFPLGGRREVKGQSLRVEGNSEAFAAQRDVVGLSIAGDGKVSGDLVFIGYGIQSGPDGFSSVEEGLDLQGKIVVMFRFEPMDGDGNSSWVGKGRWSRFHNYGAKFTTCRNLNAAGAILINPPGCADSRANEMTGPSSSRASRNKFPALLMSTEAGRRLAKSLGGDLDAWRKLADEGGKSVPLNGRADLSTEIEENRIYAENVGGMLEGRGSLKDELIIIGAHLDHLGMGSFGSRAPREQQGTVLHPGADDNASGVAAVIMLGRRLSAHYKSLPPDQPLRSILFVGWSAEESGLNGSQYYVQNPIIPLEKHALVINFDMIGRISGKRLSVSGVDSEPSMSAWLTPILEKSSLKLQVRRGGGGGGSDHASFARRQVPFLFSINDLHADYHTPRDTSDKINRRDAILAIDLYEEITRMAAARAEPFERTGGGDRR